MSQPAASPNGVQANHAQANHGSAATLDDLAQRMDDARQAVSTLDDEPREIAEQALAVHDELHRSVLTTLVRTLKADERGKRLLFELIDDQPVRMVLMMHGILRPDPHTAATAVIAGLRPSLHASGGDVELVELRKGVAVVRWEGACTGCSSAAARLRDGVEKALIAGIPGISTIETAADEATPTMIPLGSVGLRSQRTR